MDVKKSNKNTIPKKAYTVRTDTKIGTKNTKIVKKGDKIFLTDIEAKNYLLNNIIYK